MMSKKFKECLLSYIQVILIFFDFGDSSDTDKHMQIQSFPLRGSEKIIF